MENSKQMLVVKCLRKVSVSQLTIYIQNNIIDDIILPCSIESGIAKTMKKLVNFDDKEKVEH